MPDQSCSVGDAQLRVVEVLRDQNPEWVDAAGECLPCVPHELKLAVNAPTLTNEILNRPTHMKPQTLNQQTFDATLANSNLPVLVDFWAEWCGPCKMLTPLLEELAVEQTGKAVVAKVNIDESPELAARFGITAIPTLILFKNGQPVETLRGVPSRRTLNATLVKA